VNPPEARSRGALFLLVALFAAVALWFVIGSEAPVAPVVRGATAPDFRLEVLAPGAAELELSSLAGRVVLLNFWATWCEPCEQEMPAMERLYERLPRDRFELVAVSIDEEPAPVLEFVERYSLRFPIVLDPGKKVAGAYQTMGVPESLLIGPDGRIVERYVGPREWDAPEYVARIEALFAPTAGAAIDGSVETVGEGPAPGPARVPAPTPLPSGSGAAASP
jgi:peroxiredoxin